MRSLGGLPDSEAVELFEEVGGGGVGWGWVGRGRAAAQHAREETWLSALNMLGTPSVHLHYLPTPFYPACRSSLSRQ